MDSLPKYGILPSQNQYFDLTTKYKFVSETEQFLAEISVPSKDITPTRKKKTNDAASSGSGSCKVRKIETFNCSLCSSTFDDKVKLRNHERNFHKKNTYMCMLPIKQKDVARVICVKKFSQNSDLMNHYKKHKSILCFICNNNKTSFTSFSNLNGHYSSAHGYPMTTKFCWMCNPAQRFDSEFLLYIHLKEKHNLLS